MRSSRLELAWYWLLLAGLVAVSGAAAHQARDFSGSWLVVAGLGLLIWFGLSREVRLSTDEIHAVYTLDDVPVFALIFVAGWAPAALVAGLVRMTFEAYRVVRGLWRHPDRVTAENVRFHFGDVALVVVTTAASGVVYGALDQGGALLGSGRNLLAVVCCAFAWFGLAFALNAVHVAVRRGELWAIPQLFRGNLSSVRFSVLMLLPLGVLMAIFAQRAPEAVLLLVVPVAMVHNALEARRKLIHESRNTILALAQYLEERDPYTLGHSQRVAGFSAAVAEVLGLSMSQVALVRRAGLIHDLGKIDVPDSILRKPGHLTEDERTIMRTHTDRAVELGQRLVALRRGLPFDLAAYHHECFDGSGHFGLQADEIPLASRILAVADTYDAMTSDRPYRRGMAETDALLRLQKARGTQLDPALVDAFMVAYHRGKIEAVKAEWRSARARRDEVARGTPIAACQP
ncbi:MAG: HD-GYP domain-containing protein [Candidatus Eremiobacteraeota bacterium]|nr:HD-GYP domain-containing protein [Candidatus Eremiobacteraeota bacterium]